MKLCLIITIYTYFKFDFFFLYIQFYSETYFSLKHEIINTFYNMLTKLYLERY